MSCQRLLLLLLLLYVSSPTQQSVPVHKLCNMTNRDNLLCYQQLCNLANG